MDQVNKSGTVRSIGQAVSSIYIRIADITEPCGCDGGSGGSPRRGGGGDGLWIAFGLIVVFGGVIGLAELTGIPLENWSTGIILFVMFLLVLLFGVVILLLY